MIGPLLLALLTAALAPAPTAAQVEDDVPISAAEALYQMLSPDPKLAEGFGSVMHRIHELDAGHVSCGHRTLCEAFQVRYTARDDGGYDVHTGILRDVVDSLGSAVMDMLAPFMNYVGLGAVARREVTWTDFVIDFLDEAIYVAGQVLGGRRWARQSFVAASPIRAIVSALPEVPLHIYPR